MSNFSNKHIKMVVNESKQESDNALKMQVEKIKKILRAVQKKELKMIKT